PLLQLATTPEPPEKDRQADWANLAEQALAGLAELGSADALAPVVPLLQSRYAGIRKQAARALAFCAIPQYLDTLRQALQHFEPAVKYAAALGLAYAGDPLAAALVFSDQAQSALTPGERLAAALALGPVGEDQLASFLDSQDNAVRDRALAIQLLL